MAVILVHLGNIAQGRGNLAEVREATRRWLEDRAAECARRELCLLRDGPDARQENESRLAYVSDRARRLEFGQASVIFADQLSNAETGAVETTGTNRREWASYGKCRCRGHEDAERRGLFSGCARADRPRQEISRASARLRARLQHELRRGRAASAKIAQALKYDGLVFVYSWPSGGGVESYTYDRESAEGAEPYLRQFLERSSRRAVRSR